MDKHMLSYDVTENITAEKVGSGDLPVLSTPALLAMMENCAKELLSTQLSDQETSVGSSVELKHLGPSPVGSAINVQAVITEHTNKKVTFQIEAYENAKMIGQALHTRVIVDNEQFMRKMKENHNM
ncbi:thioesterase family protein [Candidatus Enterococcus ferrettii]|uniref:Fluoroacetyl-CoA-specific thioesterase-like domain-containing protein n=1 Tax=Candidatus Enterococcus ferrettii TaxID=2815324 RepID=A0ABV0ENS7_9ENTE|nr:thioesterase family protein [Enterococcus sp. 665A]MBO1340888.1 thioesterase family protein [Enterococcus sp. 665A]